MATKTSALVSPEEDQLWAFIEEQRKKFDDMKVHGREKKRGKYEAAIRTQMSNNKALTILSSNFDTTLSALQQSFDRAAKKADPFGDYRVLEHEDGTRVLINMNHDSAWDEWESFLIDKLHPSNATLNAMARELNAITK